MTAPSPAPGNAKRAAALAGRAEQLAILRTEIAESLAVLANLADQLEDLAASRQRVRARLVTAETREILDAQTRRDRAAARGLTGRNPDRSLAWMHAPARIGTGQVPAPVETLPALSVVAEIRFTLRHHIRRLGRPAKLTALEVEQTAEEDYGFCPWPRHPILITRVDVDDHGVDHLAVRLARLVGVYTNRRDLEALKRELDRLEEAAKDITEGMPGKSAMSVGHETCPHCRRDSLALLSRVPGVTALVIRCEGDHTCRCDDDLCACRRRPAKRHEWINSGHATHTWHDLKRAQTKLKEHLMLDSRALDAIERIRAMHQPSWTDEQGVEHTNYVVCHADDLPADHECIQTALDSCDPESGDHLVPACIECRWVNPDTLAPAHPFWPCSTYVATELDTDTTDPE